MHTCIGRSNFDRGLQNSTMLIKITTDKYKIITMIKIDSTVDIHYKNTVYIYLYIMALFEKKELFKAMRWEAFFYNNNNN